MPPKQPPKPVGSRRQSSAERVRRHRERRQALMNDLISALREVRVFVNPEEGPIARLALRNAEAVLKRADAILKRAGKSPITEDDYDDDEGE